MVASPSPDSPSPATARAALGAVLAKTVTHFFPKWNRWGDALQDPRDPVRITYPARFLVWIGVLLFLCKLGARRQLRFAFATPEMLANVNALAGTRMAQLADSDTLAYFLKDLPLTELPAMQHQAITRLLRMKVLDPSRLEGHVLVAVDGTGLTSATTRHCDTCLTRTHKDGTVCYYHTALEAKLVTPHGLAFSMGVTEFIENMAPEATKQDCELKAFARLAARLKHTFPQLRICLLLDALYAVEPVLKICRENGWKYLITFKEGRGPERWREYQALKTLTPANRCTVTTPEGLTQAFAWVIGLPVGAETANVLECQETDRTGHPTPFVWLTNFAVDARTVRTLANEGGRLRWKEENQGFNEQKCGGYEMEHGYSQDWHTAKNFYFLLQLGHLMAQLVEQGHLLRQALGGAAQKVIGGVWSLARYLLESLRSWVIPAETLDLATAARFQIRLNSS